MVFVLVTAWDYEDVVDITGKDLVGVLDIFQTEDDIVVVSY